MPLAASGDYAYIGDVPVGIWYMAAPGFFSKNRLQLNQNAPNTLNLHHITYNELTGDGDIQRKGGGRKFYSSAYV